MFSASQRINRHLRQVWRVVSQYQSLLQTVMVWLDVSSRALISGVPPML
jgi:hypothetical protein